MIDIGKLLVGTLLFGSFAGASEKDLYLPPLLAKASNDVAKISRAQPVATNALIKAEFSLGQLQISALDFKGAEKSLQRALELNKRRFKNIHGDIHDMLYWQTGLISLLGDAQLRQGKFEKAMHTYKRGLHTARLGVPAASPLVKHMRTGLAVATARHSTRQAAEALFSQLEAASKRASGDSSYDMYLILLNWIELRAFSGELDTCSELARQLCDVARKVYATNVPELANALVLRASVIYAVADKKGDTKLKAKAMPLLVEALEIRRTAFGADDARTRQSEKNIAELKRELGNK